MFERIDEVSPIRREWTHIYGSYTFANILRGILLGSVGSSLGLSSIVDWRELECVLGLRLYGVVHAASLFLFSC